MFRRFSTRPCSGAGAPLELCFLAALLFTSLSCSSASAAIYISGRVGLLGDNSPVADVSIALYPKGIAAPFPGREALLPPAASTQSLGNGSFLLIAPSKGLYHLVVQKVDYFTSDWPLSVPAKGVSGLQLTITRPPTLRLRLIGSNGKPVRAGDATIWTIALPLHNGESRLKWDTRAVSDTGAVEVTMPSLFPAEVGRVGVGVRSAQSGCGRVWLNGPPTAPITLRLQQGITLRGKVLDANGNPAAGARVAAGSMSHSLATRITEGWAGAVTDAKGIYEIPSLFPDRYTVETRFLGGGTAFRLVDLSTPTLPVVLAYSERLDRPVRLGPLAAFRPAAGQVNIALPSNLIQVAPAPPLVVAGRLLSKGTHAPIAAGVISLNGLEFREVVDVAQSGADGAYSLEAPIAGQYLLIAQGDKHTSVVRRLIVPLESSAPIDIEMPSQLEMTVHLLTADGKAMSPDQVQWNVTTSWTAGQTAIAGVSVVSRTGMMNLWAPAAPATRRLTLQSPTHVLIAFRDATVGCAVVNLDTWPTTPLTVQLHKGATLMGTVLNSQGKPAGDTKLSLLTLSPSRAGVLRPIAGITLPILADVNGKFSVLNLPAGSYQLRAKIPGAGPIIQQITVAGADQNVTIRPDGPAVAPVAPAGGVALRTNKG